MFEISKDFAFSAGHRLTGLVEGHPCGRVHGHNYLVRVRLLAPGTDSRGFVADYGDLKPFGQYLDSVFDHRWLGSGVVTSDAGETLPVLAGELRGSPADRIANPTAENLAAWFRCWLGNEVNMPALAAAPVLSVEVGVSETPKTWAWAR